MRTCELLSDVAAIARIEVVPTILEVVCRTTGMGFSAVARVTEKRWVACAVHDKISFGLAPGGELKVETTICDEIRTHGQVVVIDHAAADGTYCTHPAPAMYGFQSYISVPILRKDGSFFGTLCAIDPRPARLKTPETIGMFRLFADLIALHLEAQDRLASSEAALAGERQTAELRDQFIAILGHDLRNPLASITAGVHILRKTPLDDPARKVLTLVERSTRRMSALIDNMLDLARGRLGGGLMLDRTRSEALAPALLQVVEELQTAWPDRRIDLNVDLPGAIDCDHTRIAQMLSNLLANAISHGADPIRVRASVHAGTLELTVANKGEPIAPALMERLFEPFHRCDSCNGHQDMGLGLYIAAEIARAHGGKLTATSDADETRFVLRIPGA